MPVPTKPNEQKIRRDNDFTWEQFAKDCLLNKYVLVIGSEAVLNRNVNPEAGGDSMKLLFDLTLRQKAAGSYDYDEEYNRLKARVKSFTELVREYNYHNVKECVYETIRNNDFVPCFYEEIEPSLMQLLQTRCFRVVITTTIDPYIEIAMEKVWGKGGFDIVQMENAQQTFKQVVFDEFGVTRPTLCYVFGKINVGKSLSENRFVLSENDAMEKISSWFETNKTNNFLKYVRNFHLLTVGCKFDDWMFRFFWFLLRGKVSTEADGQVAVEVKEDDKLRKYLDNEKVQMFPDARLFMHEAVEKIKSVSDISQLARNDNGVFISYAHEDKYIALPLFERLHAEGVNVWIDENKLDGGAEYENLIRKAINNCKVFMPILSSQVKSDLISGKINSRWYQQEWTMAQNRYNDEKSVSEDKRAHFKVIPVIVGDYRYNEQYHQQMPMCIEGATAFEMAKETIKHLVELING